MLKVFNILEMTKKKSILLVKNFKKMQEKCPSNKKKRPLFKRLCTYLKRICILKSIVSNILEKSCR